MRPLTGPLSTTSSVALDPRVGQRHLFARALEHEVDPRVAERQPGDLDAVSQRGSEGRTIASRFVERVRAQPEPALEQERDRAGRPGLRLARHRVGHRLVGLLRAEGRANSSGRR